MNYLQVTTIYTAIQIILHKLCTSERFDKSINLDISNPSEIEQSYNSFLVLALGIIRFTGWDEIKYSSLSTCWVV